MFSLWQAGEALFISSCLDPAERFELYSKTLYILVPVFIKQFRS